METTDVTAYQPNDSSFFVPIPRGVSRVFRSPTTAIYAGIVAPIVCFALQRPILSGSLLKTPGLGLISTYWLFSFVFIGLEMLVLALWLALGTALGAGTGPVAGALFVGTLFAGGLGFVLLPLSIFGLFVIVGVLGFVPWLTAATYLANAEAAFGHARKVFGGARLISSVLLGALLVIGVPCAVQTRAWLAVRSSLRDVASGNPRAMEKLRGWYPFSPPNTLVWSYFTEVDLVRKQRLADAYKELTGEDVNLALGRLMD
jgi:hypothetical protein